MATRVTYRNLASLHDGLSVLPDLGATLAVYGLPPNGSQLLSLLEICLAICRQRLDGQLDRPSRDPLSTSIEPVLQEAAEALAPGAPTRGDYAEAALHLVERCLGLPWAWNVDSVASNEGGRLSRGERRIRQRRVPCGTYGTPRFIAQPMMERLLRELKKSGLVRPAVLDLSVEAGQFPLTAAIFKPRHLAVSFHGIDRDPVALDLANRVVAFELEGQSENSFELSTSCRDSLADSLPGNWPQKLDAIVGNPPWQPMDEESRCELRVRFGDFFPPRSDVSLAFLLRAHELLAEGGLLSFVLPCGFLFNRNAAKVRRLLLSEYEILQLTLYPRGSFIEVPCLIPISFLARKKPAGLQRRHRTAITYSAAGAKGTNRSARSRRVEVANLWRRLPGSPLHPLASTSCEFLTGPLGEPLSRYATLIAGARLARERCVPAPVDFQGLHARDILEFHVCERGLRTYEQQHRRFDRAPARRLFDSVKVVYQDLRDLTRARRLVAAVAGPGLFPVSTASLLLPLDPQYVHFFAALLNSSFANAWYKVHDLNRSIKLHFLRQLPLRHEPDSWDRIGALGRECAKRRRFFHRYLPTCTGPGRDELLAQRFPVAYRAFAQARRELDERVFDLYRLTTRQQDAVVRLSSANAFLRWR